MNRRRLPAGEADASKEQKQLQFSDSESLASNISHQSDSEFSQLVIKHLGCHVEMKCW